LQKTVDIAAMNGDPIRPGSDPGSPENIAHKSPLLKMDATRPPTIEIGYLEFPRMIYKWPKQKFSLSRRKNELGEIERFQIANEAQSKTVSNQAEFDAAVKAGWKKEHYVLPDVPEFFEEDDAAS
jgi:hypothetical protein